MKKSIIMPAIVCVMMATYTASAQNKGAKQPQGEQQHHAQPPEDPHKKAQESAEKAAKRYGLNEDQKNKWQTVAMQRHMERMALKMQMQHETTPEQRNEIRAQAKMQNDNFDTAVKQFLTPEQYAKFTKDRQEHEKKRKAAAKNKKKAADDKVVYELEEN